MDIELNWQNELPLKYSSNDDAYTLDLEAISEVPGIYIFGRRHGKLFEALYVGKASILRGRIKTQLNNHKLLKHV
jgi:excinuclease UvrABC nuclease subunit